MTSRWPRLAAGLLGFLWFLQIGGGPTLNPLNVGWLFAGDWQQHWLGWLFFRREPWANPLGLLTAIPYPVGSNIGFTDSNPLVSILLKPFSGMLPAEVQFIGPWLALCFVMQGYMGAALASVATKDAWQQTLAGYLFVLSPVLVGRLFHDTLCAHWILLALLYLGLREYPDDRAARRATWWSAAAVGFAAGTHPYLTAMAYALALALYARLWRSRHIGLWRAAAAALFTTAVMAGMFRLIGYLSRATIGASGFGQFSSDLLTLVNPTHFSKLLPALPMNVLQQEGLGFVGLGGLVACAAAVALALWQRPRLRAGTWPVVAAAILLGVYALSATVTLAGDPVLDLAWLYQPVIGLVTPFRASGRFIWALHYLTLLFGVWGATRILGPSRPSAGTALLALAVALQAADLKVDPSWAAVKKFRQAPAAELALATGRYEHLALYPMQVLGVCGDPYEEEHVYRFMMLAYRLQMTFNSGIYARVQADRISAECARLDRKVNAGELDPKTLYVVTPSAVTLFRDAGASCGRFDGDWLCVAKDSDESFRRLLDTGKPPA